MTRIEPPVWNLGLWEYRLRIDTGELLFPVLAIAFCGMYYWDTRGLPEQSLMYAEPLLYMVAVFAIIVVFEHAIVFESIGEGGDRDSEDPPPGGSDEAVDETRASSSNTRETETVKTDGSSHDVSESASVDSLPNESVAATATEDDDTEESDIETDPFFNVYTATGLSILSLVYVALLYFEIPFAISTMGFLIASLYMFGERSPVLLIGYSAVFTGVIWAVFIYWLNLPLP